MKNAFLILILFVFAVSCNKNKSPEMPSESVDSSLVNQFNPIGVDSANLIPGSYLFYLDESTFIPILNDRIINQKEAIESALIAQKKAAIIDYFKASSKFLLKEENVFVLSFSGVLIEGISETVVDELLKDNIIKAVQQNFTFQNIRATMQSNGPMIQNIRPTMQQEWQYDVDNHTSTNVSFVNPNQVVGDTNHKIWIVDTGVDSSHQDLNVIDDPEYSKSFVDTEPDPLYDILGHGTHCAGIASGKAHNNSNPDLLGMNGVSPGAPIVSVKVIDWNGEGKWTSVIYALDHIFLKANEGDVVSLSIGSLLPGSSSNNLCTPGNGNTLREIIKQIKNLADKGVFVIMAAGNIEKPSEKFYPGCFNNNNVITIGSTNTVYSFLDNTYSSTFSTFSNYGIPSIDFVAPGEFMFSTFPNNHYAVLSGTSMATALVAGIVHAKGALPSKVGAEIVSGPPGTTTYPIAKVH
jgi:hypothetical protein